MSQATFMSAVKARDVQTVIRLIKQGGIDVNARNFEYRRTPIFHANLNIMEILIANGAQVNLQDARGWTPLHVMGSIERRVGDHEGCCELLLANDADMEAITQGGNTPLHLAAYRSEFKLVDIMMTHQRSQHGQAGVDSLVLKTNENNGRNALHWSAHNSTCARTSRVLMEHCRGEDGTLSAACHQMMFAKDCSGCVAIRGSGNPDMVKYLASFQRLPLAVGCPRDDSGLAVVLNPRLDDFQRAIATDCLNLIRTTSCVEVPDATAYIMLGYLSPSDVMKRSEN